MIMRRKIAPADEALVAVGAAGDLDTLKSAVRAAVEGLGFHYYIYGVRYNLKRTPKELTFTNYPQRWRNHYVKHGYEHIDPTVLHCVKRVVPALWDENLFTTPEQQRLLREARVHGLNVGASFPVHRWSEEVALFSMCSRDEPEMVMPKLHATLAQGQLLALHIHEAVCRLIAESPDELPEDSPLTPRELDCLRTVAEGMTAREAAAKLGVAESTIVQHLKRVAEKLGTSGREQSITRAISLGLIKV
ncbi:helix-turn-helix transcriptional regulator [Chitinimonas koreensis]|uniref:helix-turn-helix transcriptional regulator n=1 Tax=Chitinimonas koreensis TaxID=356302 RepID=UPI000A06C46A|nr:LuxR family transcriptional regulator [Chitinimonas koreensis]